MSTIHIAVRESSMQSIANAAHPVLPIRSEIQRDRHLRMLPNQSVISTTPNRRDDRHPTGHPTSSEWAKNIK